jgi:hypothetical protein
MDMVVPPQLPIKIITHIEFDHKTEKFTAVNKIILDLRHPYPIIALPVIHNESRHQSK